jgi:micrococcal nuclease
MLSDISNAAEACLGLRDGPKGVVTQVTDGDTVLLDNGIIVRLIGTQAPKLALGREGFVDWPLADKAKAELEKLVLGKPVLLRYGGEVKDRYDRALAQMFTTDGAEVWAQQAMVAKGLARVYSFPDNRKCLEPLFGAERVARTNRLGIWADPYYSVRQADKPDALLQRAGHYELVEGRVLQAEKAGGRLYLNFGRSWKSDFTAVLDNRAQQSFAETGPDPLALEGVLVRIRGWIDDKDGPRIEVTHPEQIEVLAVR